MNVIKKSIDFLNPGQIPVITVDQPLYSVVKQIQWNWPDTYGGDKFVIIPGGLHIEMATLSTLGNWLEDSGWCNALSQAAIASPGVANGFLTGSNVKRTRHAHEVTASALFFLQHKSFRLFKADGLIPQSMLFEEWCEDRSTHSPQFKFWHITLQLELLYLLFVRSLGNQTLYCTYISSINSFLGFLLLTIRTMPDGCLYTYMTWAHYRNDVLKSIKSWSRELLLSGRVADHSLQLLLTKHMSRTMLLWKEMAVLLGLPKVQKHFVDGWFLVPKLPE